MFIALGKEVIAEIQEGEKNLFSALEFQHKILNLVVETRV